MQTRARARQTQNSRSDMTEPPHTEADAKPPRRERPRLRLWPAVLVLLLQFALMFGPETLVELQAEPADAETVIEQSLVDNPQNILYGKLLGPAAGALLLAVWWLLISRAGWKARVAGLVFFTACGWASMQLMHSTMFLGFILYAVPTATTGVVASLWLASRAGRAAQYLSAATVVVVAFAGWTLVRIDGVDGDLNADLSWRWAQTREEQFLATRNETTATALPPTKESAASWPGFRGPNRNGVFTGLRVGTDWPESGPAELWRRQVGPGWSSFCVVGGRLFTQEQRGDAESVVCYDAGSGAELWEHRDTSRFDEFISGAGPRATPTFADGSLFTVGASGDVNCLNPDTGAVRWTRNIVDDTSAPIPMWGFSGSPLVCDGLVIIYGGAGRGKSLIACRAADGEIVWTAGDSVLSYSSPQFSNLHGVDQVLMMSEDGLVSFRPADGQELWRHTWPLGGGAARIVQPAVIGNDIVIGTGYGVGSRRISVSLENGDWSTRELWSSLALKPYFNDFVVVGENAFGFDGAIFTCVDLESGKRRWKRGRYGSGQVLLVSEQNLLVVLSEKGEIVLLEANLLALTEVRRFRAVTGKTWNHPVIADGRLFVRNGSEAACFDLSIE